MKKRMVSLSEGDKRTPERRDFIKVFKPQVSLSSLPCINNYVSRQL